jgi:hypothetical protein
MECSWNSKPEAMLAVVAKADKLGTFGFPSDAA